MSDYEYIEETPRKRTKERERFELILQSYFTVLNDCGGVVGESKIEAMAKDIDILMRYWSEEA